MTALAAVLVMLACRPAERTATGTPEGSPADTPAASDVVAAFAGGTTYGTPLTLSEVTKVSDILDDPATWMGKRVLVQGLIVAVCEKKGCWMDIASDREFEKIQIKVDDGVIVFPLTAKGKSALVEGIVEQLDLTEEEARAEAQRKAEEHGEAFDPSSVTGPQTILRIRGLGAVVTD
jgi:hypothetical protein